MVRFKKCRSQITIDGTTYCCNSCQPTNHLHQKHHGYIIHGQKGNRGFNIKVVWEDKKK